MISELVEKLNRFIITFKNFEVPCLWLTIIIIDVYLKTEFVDEFTIIKIRQKKVKI